MADQKLSQLTAATLPLAGTELAYLVQGGAERRTTAAAMAAALPDATTSTAGKLSATDKAKLDSITVDQATIVRRWVRNETGSTIAKGVPVYISVSNGTTPTIIPADASTEETAARTIGLTQAAINHQTYGWVIEVGRLEGINTSTLTEGQIIWLSETTGQMTSTRPTQPAHGVILGYCVKQGAGTSGIIDVKVDNGLELAELHDVLVTGAVTDDVLALASDGLWKKRTLGSAAAAATTDFAPAAQGVTNGNSHNHDGGDGAQIAYSSLSGLPTLGDAAALNVGTTAGTVAAGDDNRFIALSNTAPSNLAATAAVGSGTQAARFNHVHQFQPADVVIPLSGETQSLATGVAVTISRWPRNHVLTTLPLWMVNTPSVGAALQFDIRIFGTSIFAALPTIDATEQGSDTAAVPAVFATTFINAGQLIVQNSGVTFHVLQIGTTTAGAGLKVSLPVRRAD